MALVGAGVDVRLLEGLGPVSAAPDVARVAGRFQLQDATAAHFREHLRTSFRVHAADGARVPMVLAEISERPVTKNVEQFSLIFHAPAGRALTDGIHTFEHSSLGSIDLFIAPVGAGSARRTVYQACFSRHLTAGDKLSGTSRPDSRDARSWRT